MKNATVWKLETAKLFCEQLDKNCSPEEALAFAEACYENIGTDIENETPQDCIDAEIDAMSSG